ncbi:MAG: bifunctional nuclease family protein [Actinomycetota bacterium]|nr:bifunctional nuclease family protein [Actinomycetota bacterium]
MAGGKFSRVVEVELIAVRVDVRSNTPVVLLQEPSRSRRTLPIFIGAPEATAIAYAIQGIETPRPLTHDLMRDLVGALGAKVDRMVVTEVVDDTYYSELQLLVDGREIRISSRPSDAIALAARTGARIFVTEELLDAAGVVLDNDEPDEDESNPEELVDEFQRFLDQVRPEDFGSS